MRPVMWPNLVEPFGLTRASYGWLGAAACVRPGVDAAWFTSEEDDTAAVERAREVCAAWPAWLLCRLHAELHQPFGVYAGETASERDARVRRRARLLEEVG